MEELNQTKDESRSVRCIVKLGGAAITCKNELEKINEENLEIVSSQLRQTMIEGSSSGKILGMDWSKRPESLEVSCNADDFDDQQHVKSCKFVLVHGAGSFGHFQASKSGVHKGGLDRALVKAGFVATRISVTTLNLEIVRSLARGTDLLVMMQLLREHSGGILSIGISPFSCGWSTSKRNVALADLSVVDKAIDSGFVPVLHGDAVLDDLQGCTILSGDVIIRHLAAHLKPEYVVFLTDVLGLYDRPPSDPNAVLVREIAVGEEGDWTVVKPTLPQHTNKQVEISVVEHDTTGGMVTKISEAAMIAKLGIDVYIVKAATSHSLMALSGQLRRNIPEDWLGTVIRFTR